MRKSLLRILLLFTSQQETHESRAIEHESLSLALDHSATRISNKRNQDDPTNSTARRRRIIPADRRGDRDTGPGRHIPDPNDPYASSPRLRHRLSPAPVFLSPLGSSVPRIGARGVERVPERVVWQHDG
ncbi:hypothetical protein WN51_01148 [Melipona quadrifasciata]|uniref:Uncharacterized protein n=1 Tax=Melipona quadrifasciata TaxID=166423 RepID=A0A0N0BFM2_9HYME|nr:hypothetical protein WN51_01148 [Melipona quadrifasciata]